LRTNHPDQVGMGVRFEKSALNIERKQGVSLVQSPHHFIVRTRFLGLCFWTANFKLIENCKKAHVGPFPHVNQIPVAAYPPECSTAKFSKRMYCLTYISDTSPVGPLRCLATITSTKPSCWPGS